MIGDKMIKTGIFLNGMHVIVDENLNEYDLVRRTLRERLFTRPWRPWRAFRPVPKPPPYYVNQQEHVIYTTKRGWLALQAETVKASN